MIGERILTRLNFLVGGFYFWGFKWRFSYQLSVTKLDIKFYIMTPTDQTSTSYECPLFYKIYGAM